MIAGRTHSNSSIQTETKQRSQGPNNRRVYAIGDNFPVSTTKSRTTSADMLTVTSQNINSTADEILDPTNIDNQQSIVSPMKKLRSFTLNKIRANPVQVEIRCIFLRVGEIDTLNERFYGEILMEASWIDPALNVSQTEQFDPVLYWTPAIELMNDIGNMKNDINYSLRYNKQGQALVTEHHRIKGIFWERMELQHFPFDVQELSLTLTTTRDNGELTFVRNEQKPSGVNRRVFTDEQEWYLFEHVDIKITDRADGCFDDGHDHPVVVCSCHAARKYGYFIWNAYFLIFLITSASFTTFPIPLSNIQGRVQIACTLLLTSITFRWLCNKALPAISYLTMVDIYAIGSIFSLCLLNIYHGVIGYINYYSSTNITGPIISVPSIIFIDRWALVVFTILFFIYQIGTLIWIFSVPLRKRRQMFAKDSQNRLRLVTTLKVPNSISIDLSYSNKILDVDGN